ncbi:MAG: N-acetyltransferase [Thermoprotei archaeon]|nr:MAG: N-acetyltransferase [Thermoprotei archaeon]
MNYISPRAKIATRSIAYGAIILGPSIIGENTYIDGNCVIGYPTRTKVIGLIEKELLHDREYLRAFDEISNGARIGSRCIIRRGTIIYEDVIIGNEVETGHNVLVREKSTIGNGTKIGTATVIDGRVKIGKNVSIQTGVYIPPFTEIGDNVFLGPYVRITNDKYPPSKRLRGVRIQNNAIVGCGAILIAGIEIGEGAVIAAGAVVTKDVPAESVVAGVPAKIIGNREEYERKKKVWESKSAHS